MLAWILNYLGIILMILGIVMLAVEMLYFAFTTFFLFFVGLAFLITGLLIFLGLLASTYLMALIGIVFLTVLSAVLLWKPLKDMHKH